MGIENKLDVILRSPITGEVNMVYATRYGATIPEMARNLSVVLGEKVEVSKLEDYLKRTRRNGKSGV